MNQYYFDSSALAKRYHPESGSAQVARMFQEAGRVLRISRLTFVEVHSVFALKVRSGIIDESNAIKLRKILLLDVMTQAIRVSSVLPEHFDAGAELIAKYGFSTRLRSLDALQLAVALDLSARRRLDHFVVSDKVLADVARLEGLSVILPGD